MQMTNTKFYGQWNPPVDQVLYENYFKERENGFFIECGAGIFGESCYFFEKYLNWEGINLEASKYAFKELVKNRPSSFLNIHTGLSNFQGILEFKDVVSAPGGGHENGSFKHKKSHLHQLENYNCKFETYKVKVNTFKWIAETFAPTTIDLFVLDVEGYELEVIQGMEDSNVLPSVMCVEYPIVGLDNIVESLYEFGYNFNFVSFNNAFFSCIEKERWFGETQVKEL